MDIFVDSIDVNTTNFGVNNTDYDEDKDNSIKFHLMNFTKKYMDNKLKLIEIKNEFNMRISQLNLPVEQKYDVIDYSEKLTKSLDKLVNYKSKSGREIDNENDIRTMLINENNIKSAYLNDTLNDTLNDIDLDTNKGLDAHANFLKDKKELRKNIISIEEKASDKKIEEERKNNIKIL